MKHLFALLFSFLSTVLIAQTSVSGLVSDSLGHPIPFANVAIFKSTDSTFVNGLSSSESGQFSFIHINSGTYFIKASAIGFNDFTSDTFLLSASLFNFNITLQSASKNLKEVSISTIKESISFKDGAITLNVEDNPLATGNTAFELLRRIPGIYTDNQNNIFLNGKSGIRIMIDGRLQRLSAQEVYTMLSAMTAENISRIEVMNNPPVKYDAEGSGGMINIVTKKVKVIGFSGSVSASASQGIRFRAGVDGNLNYKGKSGSLFSNFGYMNRTLYNTYIFNRVYDLPPHLTFLNETGATTNFEYISYFKVGGDYTLSPKTTVGFLINGGPRSAPFNDRGVNEVSGDNVMGYDYTTYNADYTEKWINPGYNINAEHKIDTLGSVINFSADLTQYEGRRQAISVNRFYAGSVENLPANNFQSTHNTAINIFTQKLDLTLPIDSSLMLESGIKTSFISSNNLYTLAKQDISTQTFITNKDFSNDYVYNENISAIYGNTKKELDKISLQTGLRVERTITQAQDKSSSFKRDRNYINLFPNISLNYKFNEQQNFSLNVSRRIDRPGYRELNPFKSYQDNYSATIGNPDLIPQTVISSEIRHSYKEQLYNTVSYSRYYNLLMGFDFQNDSTKETISTLTNLRGSNYISLNTFFQKGFTKYLNCRISTTGYFQEFFGELNGTEIYRRAFAFNGNFNADIILPKELRIQINSFYNGPVVNGIQEIRQNSGIDVSLRKSFFDRKLSLTLSFFDILHKNIYNMRSVLQNQNYIFVSVPDSRRVFVNMTYKFGKVRVQKREVHSNEEERGRISSGGK